MDYKTVSRVINRIDDRNQLIPGMSLGEARRRLLSDDPREALEIPGSYALIAQEGEVLRLARSLDRPLRYFLAKQESGPLLVVADRIELLRETLEAEGFGDQFHASYSRMIPAHHVTELRLVGCPDPNPVYRRFFDPPRSVLPPDLDLIGRQYVEALCSEIRLWIQAVPKDEPMGVLFSGGLDSGAVLLCLHHELLRAGHSPSRLKAFTLALDGVGEDVAQTREFLARTQLEMLHEVIDVSSSTLDLREAVSVIEDYKPLDVECAAMVLATCRGVRERYPDWRLLVDGDGGDENLKDYPIEENPELTIRSVVNNRMLYQEGWGVDAIKHSLTYSGGLSRGCVRGYAPMQKLGFSGFSPMTRPAVIAVAEAIPFAELTAGSHQALYRLKAEVLTRGVQQVLGGELPEFPKRRFQHGAVAGDTFDRIFGDLDSDHYRHLFAEIFG
jgi:asparagine synthase (glutamine-hydrolysing)